MKWYVLFVQTGKEEDVKRKIQMHLVNIQYKCFIPKRMVPEKKNGHIAHIVKMMFPGYIFIRVRLDFNIYYKIISIPNLISLLNYSNKKDMVTGRLDQDESNFFKCISDEEMTQILDLIDPENDTIHYSKIHIQQEKLSIISGPLVGLEERIIKVDKRKMRAKISFPFMGEERLIDLGLE